MEDQKIYALIDELREEVELSKNALFSKNKAMDPDFVNSVLDDMKVALDEALEESSKVLAERDSIIDKANRDAEAILRDANLNAKKLVSESDITKNAQDQAQQLVEKARARAAEIKKSAYEYADDVFSDLDEYYKESQDLLAENIGRLRNKKEKPQNQQQGQAK